ncbi:hypothetical protein [Anaerophaga thermohalophila]|nr:hypothetical protein [Anaerophaga thermohalophila]
MAKEPDKRPRSQAKSDDKPDRGNSFGRDKEDTSGRKSVKKS